MLQRFVTFGLNESLNGNPLSWCVADTIRMERIAAAARFQEPEVRVLLDAECTAARMREVIGEYAALPWQGWGDRLFIHYSGHGTQVRDLSGDEPDGLDESLCPYDFDFDNRASWLTDDDLVALLAPIPRGVNVTLIIDACHAGTLLRHQGFFSNTHTPRRARRLVPRKAAALPAESGWRSWLQLAPKLRRFGSRLTARTDALLLSATKATQLAADADEFRAGAHTYALEWVIGTFGLENLSHQQLRNRMRKFLNAHGYGGPGGQTPQLQGWVEPRTWPAFKAFLPPARL